MSEQLALLGAVAERDRIIAAFEANHATYLTAVRAFAREIAMRNGVVCIDDLRSELERRDFPMPREIGCDERIFGAVFCKAEFRPIGQRRTMREAWAKRVGAGRSAVTIYKLRDEAA